MEVTHNDKVITDPEDRDSIIYQKGFSAGTGHQRSSPETLAKIAQMSEDITNLKVETGEIKTDVKYLVKSLDAHMAEEKANRKAYDETLEKKAGIWVEKVLIWGGSAIGIILIGTFMSLIIK